MGLSILTVAPLVNLWGFGFKQGKEPSKQKIDSLKQLVGYKKVSLIGKGIKKADKRIMLDCSAIAKGYGSDMVARLFRKYDIKNFMIEIGGRNCRKRKQRKSCALEDWA